VAFPPAVDLPTHTPKDIGKPENIDGLIQQTVDDNKKEKSKLNDNDLQFAFPSLPLVTRSCTPPPLRKLIFFLLFFFFFWCYLFVVVVTSFR
jgi:hypothetical protein